ncbi:MAG: phosphatidylglycerophosphatase A [Caldimicrobium sp.]
MNLKKQQKTPPFNGKRISLFLATGGFIGYLPPFPGTLGAIQGVFLYYLMSAHSLTWHLFILLLLTGLGIGVSQIASEVLEKKDPDQVIIDEIVGAYLSCLGKSSFLELTLAFIFFRIIDITKPSPLRKLEHLKGGWGIMVDDLLAGLMTNVIVTLVMYLYLTLK